MDIVATQKFLILSPRKIRPVARAIKKMKPVEAIERLPFVGKRSAAPLEKVIRQAIANARTKGISEGDLSFKEIQIGEGPRLKRGRPVSRGQWHPVKKRMSHIRVVLEVKTTNEGSKMENKEPEGNTFKKEKKLHKKNV